MPLNCITSQSNNHELDDSISRTNVDCESKADSFPFNDEAVKVHQISCANVIGQRAVSKRSREEGKEEAGMMLAKRRRLLVDEPDLPIEEGNVVEEILSSTDQEIESLLGCSATWYPAYENEHSRIAFDLSSGLNTKPVIYAIRNRSNGRCLIGETGSLRQRASGYLSRVNQSNCEDYVREGKVAFYTEFRQDPCQFEIAVIYELKEGECLKEKEIAMIKRFSDFSWLYNDNRGGGGGLPASAEAKIDYAISTADPVTPVKSYPYHRDENGNIRITLTPTFAKKVEKSQLPTFTYRIKNRQTGERYVGITSRPDVRPLEHAYLAECCDPMHPKSREAHQHVGGRLYPAMGKAPEDFEFGLYTVARADTLDQANLEKHALFTGTQQLEIGVIALVNPQLNSNRGGGGGISGRVAKRLVF